MRIQPVFSKFNGYNRANKTQTQFERKNNSSHECIKPLRYTGIASVDLAYVSMFDLNIAKDLASMGLI